MKNQIHVVQKEIPRKCRNIQYDLCGAKYVMMEGSGKSRLAKFARETSPDSQLGNVPNHIPAWIEPQRKDTMEIFIK